MELSVLERILLLQALPREGSFANLKLLREIREALSFNEEENRLLNFRQTGEQMTWSENLVIDKDTDTPVEIDQAILAKDPEAITKMVANNPARFEFRPAVPAKEVEIGDVANKLIGDGLKELDKQEKLTESHFSLYERFVEGDKNQGGSPQPRSKER